MNSARDKIQAIEEKANLYIRAGKLHAAENMLKSFLDHEPDASNILILLATVYQKQSKFPSAIEALSQALTINPDFLEASVSLCITLCELSQYEEAQEVYDKLKNEGAKAHSLPKTIRGRLANSHGRNGQMYQKSGLISEATGEYLKALHLYPDMPDIRFKLAQLYMRQGHLTKAHFELTQIISKRPNDAETLAQLGVISYRQNKVDQARDFWKKALQSDPQNPVAKPFLTLVEKTR